MATRIKIENETFGADPEVFLKDGNGKPISGVGIIPGTKEEPLPMPWKDCALQRDNVMAEFNIPPCTSVDEVKTAIANCLDHITSFVPGGTTLIRPAVEFDEDQLNNPDAQEVGCSTVYNLYTLSSEDPVEYDGTNWRYAGGHIHLGFPGSNHDNIIPIGRLMDLCLGVPSVILDNDIERKKVYGNAGKFRPKPYGLEYRVLSNFWIADEQLIEWAWNATKKAIAIHNDETFDMETDFPQKRIVQCINENDVDEALVLMEEFDLMEGIEDLVKEKLKALNELVNNA